MDIKNLFIAIATRLNNGVEPTQLEVMWTIVFITVITIVIIGISIVFLFSDYIDAAHSVILSVHDYDDNKYKIFLLKENPEPDAETGFYKGDFYHLSDLISRYLTFSDVENSSVSCKVLLSEANQSAFAIRNSRAVSNFQGILFYDRDKDRWAIYNRPPTVILKFYSRDNQVHVDVKAAVIGSHQPDMPLHTNLDNLLSMLTINHRKDYTMHFKEIDKQFKRGRLENG